MLDVKQDQLVLRLEREKETKRTVRFVEDEVRVDDVVVGVLYVQKAALARLGNPERLHVVIEGLDSPE